MPIIGGPALDQWAEVSDYLPRGSLSMLAQIVTDSWLRVSGTAERAQIDQRVGHQFHPVVPLLFELKA